MRLIDADALLDDCVFSSKEFEKVMREFIGDAPTVKPEIIRCEDCHYYDGEHCDMHNAGMYPTDYCSYAVWKYEEDET